jgi:molybdopterin converting factor small subunit
VLFCMVNYDKARLSQRLADGDTVSFLSLVAGG